MCVFLGIRLADVNFFFFFFSDRDKESVQLIIGLLAHDTFPDLQKSACLAILGATFMNPEIGRLFVERKAIDSLVPIVKSAVIPNATR